MKKLYFGIEDEDGDIPGNVFEEGELISSVLIPSEDLSDREKPGEVKINEDMEDNPLEDATEIDPSEYLVKRWDDGKAKRIYSGMIGSLADEWKEVDFIEIYGDGKIYADEEKVKGDFTTTHDSTVLIKDVQDIAERTDRELEKEYFHCIHCGKEIRSYRAIEDALPDDWVIDPDETDKESYMERRDDGSVVLKGICPECEKKERDENQKRS
ncbi:MAG: hypothetical protein KGY66_02010 [Candidatus Thermoplasmatota archaeon]|nr:hypothetical protein [Candidatus Thermoplasmatota archaeon]MBS3789672.1 hypothetical protein [Candidatus Thermoplasmatota archaeon]